MNTVAPEAQNKPTALFVDTRNAAARLGLAFQTLCNMRGAGAGPRFHKFGGAIRYKIADLDAYAERCARCSTSQGAAAA